MTDYSQLSEFEINKAVAKAVGFPCYYGDGSYSNGLGTRQAIVKGVNCYGSHMIGGFEPCNNPSDAWPIIVENKISLSYDAFAEEVDGGKWVACPALYEEEERVRSDNPLRAAMIVYLMIKESESS